MTMLRARKKEHSKRIPEAVVRESYYMVRKGRNVQGRKEV